MGARGRKSAAAMAVVQPDGITAIARPSPPDELTDEQAHEWRVVVNRMPADWFPAETHGILAQYCRHLVSARHIADLIDSFLSSSQSGEDWVAEYERLLRMQEREGRAMAMLATRMRLTHQSKYSARKSAGTTVLKKPF